MCSRGKAKKKSDGSKPGLTVESSRIKAHSLRKNGNANMALVRVTVRGCRSGSWKHGRWSTFRHIRVDDLPEKEKTCDI